jgi:hypothetical protein
MDWSSKLDNYASDDAFGSSGFNAGGEWNFRYRWKPGFNPSRSRTAGGVTYIIKNEVRQRCLWILIISPVSLFRCSAAKRTSPVLRHATRLRLVLVDDALADQQAIGKVEGVKGVFVTPVRCR